MKRERLGITIVEAVAVIAILAVLMSAAASYFQMSARVRITNTKQAIALMEAENFLEIWTRSPRDQRVALSGMKPAEDKEGVYHSSAPIEQLGREQVTRIVTRSIQLDMEPVEELTVEVNWFERQAPRNIQLIGWRLLSDSDKPEQKTEPATESNGPSSTSEASDAQR